MICRPLQEWNEEDIHRLVQNKQEETVLLEFKQELDLSKESHKKSLIKTLSGFANSQGGLLIYGIETGGGDPDRATDIKPLEDPSIPKRAEDFYLSTVVPSLPVQQKRISLSESGYILLLKIEQTPVRPHLAKFEEDRFYVRRNHQTEPMSEQMAEKLFELRRTKEQQIQDRFRQVKESLPVNTRLRVGLTTIPYNFDSRMIDTREQKVQGFLSPLQGGGFGFLDRHSWGYGPDGFQTEAGSQHVGIIKRNGDMGYLFKARRRAYEDDNDRTHPPEITPADTLMHMIVEILLLHAYVLHQVEFTGQCQVHVLLSAPFRNPVVLARRAPHGGMRELDIVQAIETDSVFYQDFFSEQVQVSVREMYRSPEQVIHPLMDYLWQAFRKEGCPYYSEEGRLTDEFQPRIDEFIEEYLGALS